MYGPGRSISSSLESLQAKNQSILITVTMAGWEEVEITPISVKALRADPSGSVVEQIAALAYQALEPP